VTFIGRPLGLDYGAQRTSLADDTFRTVFGLRGDFQKAAAGTFLDDWEWDLTGTFGVSRFTSMVSDTLREPLTRAVQSCSNPRDLSNCFNPFYSAIDGKGTPNSQAVIDSFSGTYTPISEHFLQTYHAGLTGSLFDLPGGSVGLAFGGELRHERRESQVDHDATEQRYTFFLGSTDLNSTRSVYSGYAELRWPFWRGIELQTAVRVERYNDIDRTSPSPFAGLTVSPADIAGPERLPGFLRKLR
jgi:iron complex outermembrane receptor protein